MEHKFSIQDAMDVAQGKVSFPGWQGFSWEAAEGGSIITGCVPDGVYSKGPRKGMPRFSRPVDGTKMVVVVSEAELAAAAKQYEAETVRCWNCKGTGEVQHGWNHESGPMMRPCKRCSGDGAARS